MKIGEHLKAKQSSAARLNNSSEQGFAGVMKSENLIERRLGRTASQFNSLADKLLGTLATEQDEVSLAIENAKGFNLISSKSTKMLPLDGMKT